MIIGGFSQYTFHIPERWYDTLKIAYFGNGFCDQINSCTISRLFDMTNPLRTIQIFDIHPGKPLLVIRNQELHHKKRILTYEITLTKHWQEYYDLDVEETLLPEITVVLGEVKRFCEHYKHTCMLNLPSTMHPKFVGHLWLNGFTSLLGW